MAWLRELISEPSAAQTVLLLSAVAALGLALGSVKVRKVGLGVAGVLFAGLLIGHFLGRGGVHLDPHVMEFAREFGLILFVYAIGIQVGPGFFGSLRRGGLPLNAMAAAVVLLGALMVVGIVQLGGVSPAAAAGLYSGAVTNTPSLAAAQQALRDVPGVTPEELALPGMAYAVAYPLGIVGIIATMLLARAVFRVDAAREAEAFEALTGPREALRSLNLEVTNQALDGVRIGDVPVFEEGSAGSSESLKARPSRWGGMTGLRGGDGATGVVVSRVLRDGVAEVATPRTVLRVGDVLHAVCPVERVEELKLIVGRESGVDVKAIPGDIASRRVLVTHRQPLGKTLGELALRERLGVNVTRVSRTGVELPAKPTLRLQYADSMLVVGDAKALHRVAHELGDSQKQLQQPHIIPIFVGVALGVLAGSWPFFLPGVPGPLKLGLAGGPLLVAILVSRLGNVGPLVWYLPIPASTMLRELGIVLFLGVVGLKSGAGFMDTVMQGDGLYWIGLGAAVTLVPLLVVAAFGRLVWKLNYLSLCGLLAGSMTDPPALAFAQTVAGSTAPAVSYATVYPLVMILRVLSGQLLVLFLVG